eukprot:TRINITY_DN30884_c0_g1_i1.p1 TRINITY_DN30884_c0_g1~~TRINITY_DN30884_c0_g1_i1.p1  ORF type:complete len:1996 (-),score=259.81 TRINITY_DN30884_c0_g1_i1:176-5590(-)
MLVGSEDTQSNHTRNGSTPMSVAADSLVSRNFQSTSTSTVVSSAGGSRLGTFSIPSFTRQNMPSRNPYSQLENLSAFRSTSGGSEHSMNYVAPSATRYTSATAYGVPSSSDATAGTHVVAVFPGVPNGHASMRDANFNSFPVSAVSTTNRHPTVATPLPIPTGQSGVQESAAGEASSEDTPFLEVSSTTIAAMHVAFETMHDVMINNSATSVVSTASKNTGYTAFAEPSKTDGVAHANQTTGLGVQESMRDVVPVARASGATGSTEHTAMSKSASRMDVGSALPNGTAATETDGDTRVATATAALAPIPTSTAKSSFTIAPGAEASTLGSSSSAMFTFTSAPNAIGYAGVAASSTTGAATRTSAFVSIATTASGAKNSAAGADVSKGAAATRASTASLNITVASGTNSEAATAFAPATGTATHSSVVSSTVTVSSSAEGSTTGAMVPSNAGALLATPVPPNLPTSLPRKASTADAVLPATATAEDITGSTTVAVVGAALTSVHTSAESFIVTTAEVVSGKAAESATTTIDSSKSSIVLAASRRTDVISVLAPSSTGALGIVESSASTANSTKAMAAETSTIPRMVSTSLGVAEKTAGLAVSTTTVARVIADPSVATSVRYSNEPAVKDAISRTVVPVEVDRTSSPLAFTTIGQPPPLPVGFSTHTANQGSSIPDGTRSFHFARVYNFTAPGLPTLRPPIVRNHPFVSTVFSWTALTESLTVNSVVLVIFTISVVFASFLACFRVYQEAHQPTGTDGSVSADTDGRVDSGALWRLVEVGPSWLWQLLSIVCIGEFSRQHDIFHTSLLERNENLTGLDHLLDWSGVGLPVDPLDLADMSWLNFVFHLRHIIFIASVHRLGQIILRNIVERRQFGMKAEAIFRAFWCIFVTLGTLAMKFGWRPLAFPVVWALGNLILAHLLPVPCVETPVDATDTTTEAADQNRADENTPSSPQLSEQGVQLQPRVKLLICIPWAVNCTVFWLMSSYHRAHFGLTTFFFLIRLLSHSIDTLELRCGGKRAGLTSSDITPELAVAIYVEYVFYPPLYHIGPVVCFAEFAQARLADETTSTAMASSPVRLCKGVLSWVVTFLLFAALRHSVWPTAVAKYLLREKPGNLSVILVASLAYWFVFFAWFKWLLYWRIFRLWAEADGIPALENVGLCPASMAGVQDIWFSWHTSLYWFLQRYVYVPLGESQAHSGSAVVVWTAVLFVAFCRYCEQELIVRDHVAMFCVLGASLLAEMKLRTLRKSYQTGAKGALLGGLDLALSGWLLAVPGLLFLMSFVGVRGLRDTATILEQVPHSWLMLVQLMIYLAGAFCFVQSARRRRERSAACEAAAAAAMLELAKERSMQRQRSKKPSRQRAEDGEIGTCGDDEGTSEGERKAGGSVLSFPMRRASSTTWWLSHESGSPRERSRERPGDEGDGVATNNADNADPASSWLRTDASQDESTFRLALAVLLHVWMQLRFLPPLVLIVGMAFWQVLCLRLRDWHWERFYPFLQPLKANDISPNFCESVRADDFARLPVNAGSTIFAVLLPAYVLFRLPADLLWIHRHVAGRECGEQSWIYVRVLYASALVFPAMLPVSSFMLHCTIAKEFLDLDISCVLSTFATLFLLHFAVLIMRPKELMAARRRSERSRHDCLLVLATAAALFHLTVVLGTWHRSFTAIAACFAVVNPALTVLIAQVRTQNHPSVRRMLMLCASLTVLALIAKCLDGRQAIFGMALPCNGTSHFQLTAVMHMLIGIASLLQFMAERRLLFHALSIPEIVEDEDGRYGPTPFKFGSLRAVGKLLGPQMPRRAVIAGFSSQ